MFNMNTEKNIAARIRSLFSGLGVLTLIVFQPAFIPHVFAHEENTQQVTENPTQLIQQKALISEPPAPPPPTAGTTDSTAEMINTPATEAFTFAPPVQFLPPQNFYKAKVLKVLEEGTKEVAGFSQPYQTLELRVDNDSKNGKIITTTYGSDITIRPDQKLKTGDSAVVVQTQPDPSTNESAYYIYDTYRLPPVWLIGLLFFGLVIFFGRWKGLSSFLGLLVSVLVLAKIIVPGIVAGWNPFVISLVGAFIIALASLYLAHGFNKKTTIALLSTLATLFLAAIFSLIFVELTHLTGLGSDNASSLQFSIFQNLNLKGLLLGGIIIGALGVLDDITTGQTAAVYEIKQANQSLPFIELYKRGLNVGREHIASLVNTLVLAYAGAALPLFLIFSGDSEIPLWVSLNSETIVEEIVRTLVGSTALVFAVPISTLLAAYYFSKNKS